MNLIEDEQCEDPRNHQIVPLDLSPGLILGQVGAIMSKPPSMKSLHELLKVTGPELNAFDIEDEGRRNKLFKTLKVRVHPDKHPNNPLAKDIFQNLTPFFSECVAAIPIERMGKRETSAKRSNLIMDEAQQCRKIQVWTEKPESKYPLEFHVRNKWRFVDFEIAYSPPVDPSEEDISKIVAFQCMNIRGTIAHGRKIRRPLNPEHMKMTCCASEVFVRYGGSKNLKGTTEIQRELMNRGPVVSTSFVASDAFMNSNEYSHVLVPPSVSRKCHPILIVGWMHTKFGMVWLVQPFRRFSNMSNPTMKIASSQYGIDNECIAPINDFMNISWQNGPYFDKDMSNHPHDWHKSLGMKFSITSTQLEELGKCFKDGIVIAALEKRRFVLRDKNKIARSQSGFLKEVQWKNGMWRISIRFTPQTPRQIEVYSGKK